MYAPMVLSRLRYQVDLARGLPAGLSMHHRAMPLDLEFLPLSTDLHHKVFMAVCNDSPDSDPLVKSLFICASAKQSFKYLSLYLMLPD